MGKMEKILQTERKVRKNALFVSLGLIVLSAVVLLFLLATKGTAAEEIARAVGITYPTAINNAGAFLAAALAVGASVVAAGIAVSSVGSSAMAAVTEKPELLGRSLIFVGLAEGLAIYGLIIAILIIGKVI